MKKAAVFLLAALCCGLFGWLPFEAVDASELTVVQVLAVAAEEHGVTVFAPEGLSGAGADFDAAIENLAAHAPGRLFLGAAEHVILTDGAARALSGIARSGALRPAVRLYTTDADAQTLMEDAQALTAFLSAHPGNARLADVRRALYDGAAVRLPRLGRKAGGYETV